MAPGCGLLESSHLNSGWQICPDGAEAMGLERMTMEKGWKRCEECHRFREKEFGNDVPCTHGVKAKA